MTEAERRRRIKRKKRINNFIIALIFLAGLAVFAYPAFTRWFYRIEANDQITDFEAGKALLTDAEVEERMRLAHAYNASLINQVSEDPFSEEAKAAGRAAYARMLEIREKIGFVEIPAIDVSIPIYAGTSEDILQKGAGHLEGTSLPVGGNSTHSVITAHSGLPTAKLFTDLEKLRVGDKFYVHNIKETMAYVVDEINVIEPEDFSKLLVAPGHDYTTLLTCTPIMINTHRLIVRGHRVEYVAAVEEETIAEHKVSFTYRYLFYAALVVIVILLLYLENLRKKKKRIERENAALKAQEVLDKKGHDRQ